jgi:hypothetical protein
MDPITEILFNNYIEDNDRMKIKETLINIEKGEKLSNEQIYELAHLGFNPTYGKECNIMILNFFKNHYNIKNLNHDLIKKMAGNKYFVDVFKLLINKKIIMQNNSDNSDNNDYIIIAIINSNVELLELLNPIFINKNLELACKYSNALTIEFLLQNKIKPTKKCFYILLKRFQPKIYFIFKNDLEKGIEMTEIPEIKIFCEYGYLITQEDFVEMIKHGIYVENYKKYDLVIDEEIKDTCNEYLLFPYQETKLTNLGFATLFKNGYTFDTIKKIEKKYKIKPDITCLKNLCKSKNPDYKILLYLTDENDIMPTEECLKSIIRYGNEKCIKHIYFKIYGDDFYDAYNNNRDLEEYENNEYRNYEKYLRSKCRQYKKYSHLYENNNK